MPDAGGAILRRGNPRAAVAGECIPGGIRAAFECDDRAGEPMGVRRKTAERGFVEIADAGGAERVAGGGLRGIVEDDNGGTNPFTATYHLSTYEQPNVGWRYLAQGVNRFQPCKSRS